VCLCRKGNFGVSDKAAGFNILLLAAIGIIVVLVALFLTLMVALGSVAAIQESERMPWGPIATVAAVTLALDVLAFFIIRGIIRKWKRLSSPEVKGAMTPDDIVGKPWLQRADWKRGRISSFNYGNPWHTAVLIVPSLFILLVGVFGLLASDETEKSDKAASGHYTGFRPPDKSTSAVVIVVGGVPFILGLFLLRSCLKYGKSVLELKTIPGVIGGPLQGVVYASGKIRPERGFEVWLRCIHAMRRRKRKISERVLHEQKIIIRGDLASTERGRVAIPFQFAIPYDAPATTFDLADRILWRLSVEAKTPGVDYSVDFEAPILKTKESTPDFVLDETALEPYIAPFDAEKELEKAGGIHAEQLPGGGQRFVFRQPAWVGLSWFIGSLIPVSLIVLAVRFLDMSDEYASELTGGLAFLGVLALGSLVWAIYNWFGEETLECKPGSLTLSRRIFSAELKKRCLASSEIEAIHAMRNPFGRDTYRIAILRRSGPDAGESEAEKVRRESEETAPARAFAGRSRSSENAGMDVVPQEHVLGDLIVSTIKLRPPAWQGRRLVIARYFRDFRLAEYIVKEIRRALREER
jgi:hypothetical protein